MILNRDTVEWFFKHKLITQDKEGRYWYQVYFERTEVLIKEDLEKFKPTKIDAKKVEDRLNRKL